MPNVMAALPNIGGPSVCIALCTIVAHNIAQNRPDNFPSYPPDNHHCYDDVYLREGGIWKCRTPDTHKRFVNRCM